MRILLARILFTLLAFALIGPLLVGSITFAAWAVTSVMLMLGSTFDQTVPVVAAGTTGTLWALGLAWRLVGEMMQEAQAEQKKHQHRRDIFR